MALVLSHGLEPTVLMLALLTMVPDSQLEFPLTVLHMMVSMELILMDMVPLLTLNSVMPMVLLELGVHTLMLPTEMLTMVTTLPHLTPVSLLDMDLVLLTTLLQVNMASDTPELTVTILLLSLLVIKAMEPTAHGELLPTQVPGPVIGLVPTALLLMALELKVYGTQLLMLGLVLSTLLLLTVPMTGPQLVLLLSMLPPLPVGPEIMKLQNLL